MMCPRPSSTCWFAKDCGRRHIKGVHVLAAAPRMIPQVSCAATCLRPPCTCSGGKAVSQLCVQVLPAPAVLLRVCVLRRVQSLRWKLCGLLQGCRDHRGCHQVHLDCRHHRQYPWKSWGRCQGHHDLYCL